MLFSINGSPLPHTIVTRPPHAQHHMCGTYRERRITFWYRGRPLHERERWADDIVERSGRESLSIPGVYG